GRRQGGADHAAALHRLPERGARGRPALPRVAHPGLQARHRLIQTEEDDMRRLSVHLVLLLMLLALGAATGAAAQVAIQAYALPSTPHDVAVGKDGIVWYTAQSDGKLGRLDPTTGKVELVSLGAAAAPHGVVIGPDGAPWVTEGGTNSIVRVDPQ